MPSPSLSPAELSYLHTSLSSCPPLRPDSRTATAFRPLSAETNILPATNGSAHLSFSDGSEAIVGVKLEVERTLQSQRWDGDAMETDAKDDTPLQKKPNGRSDWITLTLTLTLPGLRDDDSQLVFLEQMLREALISPGTEAVMALQDALVINMRWHWHVYVDVVLISTYGITGYPLPLLSLTVHLALRDARVPRLKSEGEEDPVADDDWEASEWLYAGGRGAKGKGKEEKKKSLGIPPVTLLIMAVENNVIFDPSREELAVADAVFAVSVGMSEESGAGVESCRILAVRTIDTQARDTMKGIAISEGAGKEDEVPGVWKPKVGGLKRSLLKQIIRAVCGSEDAKGVAQEVIEGLEEFSRVEDK